MKIRRIESRKEQRRQNMLDRIRNVSVDVFKLFGDIMCIINSRFSLIFLLLFVLACVEQGDDKTVNSDQVSTDNIIAWGFAYINNVNTEVSVYMRSAEWRSTDYDFGGRIENFHPDIVLSNGEHLEVTYNGEQKHFSNGARSPYKAEFVPNDSPLQELKVTFYRQSGEAIEIFPTSGIILDFSINEVILGEIGYDSAIPISWSNARYGEYVNIDLEADCTVTGRRTESFSVEDSGMADISLASLFDSKPSQQCTMFLGMTRRVEIYSGPLLNQPPSNFSVWLTREINFDVSLSNL